eukprot:10094583-Prorocentrum_lima.AAC.1
MERANAAGQQEDEEAVDAFGSAAPAMDLDDLREAMIATAEAAEARGDPLYAEPPLFPPAPPAATS